MPLVKRLSPTGRQRLLFLFLCFVWGTTWLGMKVGIASVPPALFSGTRWTVAGLVLLGIRRYRGEPVRPPPRLLGRLLLVSVLLIALNQVPQLYGLKYVAVGLAAVINSALTPMALLGFAVALGQERFKLAQLAAMALGVLGVLVLFGPSALEGTLDLWQVLGAAGVILGCLSYSLGSVLVRPMMRTLDPVQLSGLTNLIGGVVLLIGSLAAEPGAWAAATHPWDWAATLAWLYLLIPGSLMATTIYLLLVRDWGASRTGTYAFVSPVVAVVAGCWLFGETVSWADGAGMALMLAAAALVLRSRSAPQPAKQRVREEVA